MKQFVSHTSARMAPPAGADLERLFGVEGMASGKRVKMRPGMALFASDIPVREQVWIGLQYVALGLAPPAIFGVLLLAFIWLH